MSAIVSVGSGTERVEITEMTEHDLLEVVEIEESCGLSRWGWEAYHAELVQENRQFMLVALDAEAKEGVEGKRIIGFIAARFIADELHVNNVAVRPRFRRMGLGRALMITVLERAKATGAERALLEVRAGNEAAQALYASCGFTVKGRRRGYYRNPTEDALVMALEFR